MMYSMWPPILFILGMVGFSTPAPFYTVIAPKVVRPNSEYHVAVSTSAISKPATIYVELSANLDSGNVFNISQNTTVQPNTTRIIKLEIGNTTTGRYKLISRGLSGIQFSNTTDLQFIQKTYSVLIQTDRAIYKPGNNVLFRVIVLDSRLLAAKNGTELDISITDGQGNRVKQWKQQLDNKGVFSGELQISDFPVMGDWKISVKVLDQTSEKVFQVAEYVLPKFEVVIDVPSHVAFKDSSITATIRAQYTYGKPVKGVATITAHPKTFPYFRRPGSETLVRKVVPIDGKAIVNFDIASELKLTDTYDQPIQLEASVEEALTGRTQNASIEINLHTYKYTIELINTASSYKPGLKYTSFLKIAYHDGSPVQDQTNPVRIWSGYSYDRSTYENFTRMLDEHGMIQLDFYPPLEINDTYAPLNIEAEYLSLHQWFSAANKAVSPSGTYIQAVLKTENPTVSRDVQIEVNSTVPLHYLSYQVLGRGEILSTDSITVSGTHTACFEFVATHTMAPTAHVIVYYVRDDGEIIADALNVQLNSTLQNFVNIQTSVEETVPGGSVDLIISSKPNSYIGLLGVDQSSILLKSGNDISRDQVLNELRSYDTNNEFSGWDSSYWHPGSSSANEVFENSGAVILTNGYLGESYPILYEFALDSIGVVEDIGFAERVPPPAVQPEKLKVRKNFPETWIWEMLDAQSDGETVLQRSVPDTITSWVLTAFCIHPVHGFGLIEEPRKLKVFQSFFISLNLPYSVIRGEIVAIQIIVFNYRNKDLRAEVVLENMGQFEFAELSNTVQDTPNQDLVRRETIEVKANSGASVSFMIVPKELGPITIKATATSPLAGDSIEQPLLVKAEGETQFRNEAIFVDLRNSSSSTTNFHLDIPKDSVAGSEHVEVSAVGDILGPSLPNLANLIRMPFGCGEQNMINFVPNIVVINYLKSINQLTPTVHGKALKFLEVGYQQELTYRHTDGSFSAFGMSDASGSTWLTAYVVKSFIQAADHITIDDRIIKDALQWLAARQALNGSFPEVGKVSHQAMQGGAAKGLALTAFTLSAFLQDQGFAKEYKDTINKGLEYMVRNLEGLDDIYSLCICTYVLNLAKHPQEEATFNILESKADQSEGYKWWSKPVSEDNENPWYSLPNSVNVEMTSYAMLTYLRRNMVAESLPIMKWLVSQRNNDGGFASTQDTVIGIYALSKLGEKIASGDSDISISFTYEGGNQSSISVKTDNNMILQKHTLPREVREVNVTATGSGFAVIQVSYNYNLNKTGTWPSFTLNPKVDNTSDTNNLHLSICAGFIPTKEANQSNMAVLEVNLPSGFTIDADSIPSLKNTPHVKRVETKNGDTMIALYFDQLVKEEYCVTISAFRTFKVAKQKPVPVSVYDYYDSSRRARVFYEPIAATLCDICEGDDCKKVCPATSESVTTE